MNSSTVSKHGIAMQLSACAALVSVALVALPIMAEETPAITTPSTSYEDYIVNLFQNTGAANPGTYDNRFVDTSAFDFAQYFSHPCYNPTDFDMARCQRDFGPFWNLKSTLESGQLAAIFKRYPYLVGAEQAIRPTPIVQAQQAMPQPQAVPAAQPDAEEEAMMFQKTRDQRSQELWDACKVAYPDTVESAACYRRNIRLLDQEQYDITIEGNVY